MEVVNLNRRALYFYPTAGGAGEPAFLPRRVLRGGSWDDYGQNCRSANRNYSSQDGRNDGIGFRLVFVP